MDFNPEDQIDTGRFGRRLSDDFHDATIVGVEKFNTNEGKDAIKFELLVKGGNEKETPEGPVKVDFRVWSNGWTLGAMIRALFPQFAAKKGTISDEELFATEGRNVQIRTAWKPAREARYNPDGSQAARGAPAGAEVTVFNPPRKGVPERDYTPTPQPDPNAAGDDGIPF